MTRATLAVALAAATACIGAAPASAVIVPQRGMAGLELTMSKEQVRAKLGKPTWFRTRNDDFGRLDQWYYSSRKVHVGFRAGPDGAQVITLMTNRGVERTSRGVGVGSTRKTVQRRVPNVRCRTFDYGMVYRTCHVGAFEPGRRVTDFTIGRSGRVGRVTVAFVID
jgi:hypothetical protein